MQWKDIDNDQNYYYCFCKKIIKFDDFPGVPFVCW